MQQKLVMNALEELLVNTETLKQTAAANALNQVAEIIHQRSLVIIFSDLFENETEEEHFFSALQHLKYRKHEVVVFHVTDKSKELDFDFENKPYQFIDLESGEEIKLNPAQIRGQYRDSVQARRQAIEMKCGQYKIDYVEADINAGFDTVLYTYLVKRQRMIK
jgi:hypothetical protein